MQLFTVFFCYLASYLVKTPLKTVFIMGAVFFVLIPSSGWAEDEGKEAIAAPTLAKLPEITYSDENGKTQTLETKGYKLTALHFWATWCVPCVKELPQINSMQKKYKSKGFRVVALSLDNKNVEKVQKFFKDNKINNLDILFDSNLAAFQQLKIKGLPTTIFIDQSGNAVGTAEGYLNWKSKKVKEFVELNLDK